MIGSSNSLKHCAALAALLLPGTAMAADQLRDLCTDRPGLGTSPCVVDAGHVQVEIGLDDWTLDKDAQTRTAETLAGDALARIGIGPRTELRVGWTAYDHVAERDSTTGQRDRRGGTGDLTFGFKQNLASPDGSGVSLALLPFVRAPVASHGLGTGDWGGGLAVPASFELADGITLEVTPEVDAEVDADRHGRHLAYGSVAGLQLDLSKAVTAVVEAQAIRDRDPAGHATEAFASAALSFTPGRNTQLDVGAIAGLNRDSADLELYVGVSRRF